ncbi:MAG: hypothetical protein HKO56_03710 [Bacteroidia bacterium]|nr:hypothetical protein [Bacteroidia bacterium]NNM15743.1 hypothetical protein [Bacteroidia bacterium]
MSLLKAPITYLILALLIAFIGFSIYKTKYSMDVIDGYEINSASLSKKVLIASQGSTFKNELVSKIIKVLNSDSTYIKVIDVTSLSTEDVNEWNAVIVIHTWEYGEAQFDAYQFAKTSVFDDRINVVTTSGNGEEQMLGIDAISSASITDEIPGIAIEVRSKIRLLPQ